MLYSKDLANYLYDIVSTDKKTTFFSGSLRRQKRSVNHWDIHAMFFCSTIACINQNLVLLNSVHGFVIVVVYCDYLFKVFFSYK